MELGEYMRGYLERVHPLTDQESLLEEVAREFEERWAAGNFPGWRVSVCGNVRVIYIIIYSVTLVAVRWLKCLEQLWISQHSHPLRN